MIAEETQPYIWKNVTIGGGGFVTGLIFNPTERGLLYARTDVGGAYRKDKLTNSWLPLLDGFGEPDWNLQGIESLATDPVEPNRLILAAGTYTNSRAGNAEILRSTDYGKTFARTSLPFKAGANEAGRGNGERLAIDPHANNIVYFGTRRDGLWKSEDFGATWAKVENFPDVPDDSKKHQQPEGGRWNFNYLAQAVGIVYVLFDGQTGRRGSPTARIFAAVSTSSTCLFWSDDAGKSWSAVPGQPLGLRPNRAVISTDGVLYATYGDEPGPNGMHDGAVWKLELATGRWTNITPENPHPPENSFGYAAISVDAARPQTLLVGTWNRHKPHDEIFRSADGGRTWRPLLEQPEWDYSAAPYTKAMPHHWLSDVKIDPFNSDHVLFTTGYGIWASRNLTQADKDQPTLWAFDDRGLEETVPLALLSPPVGAHLVSGLGDIDGFCHDDLDTSPGVRFDAPGFKNTEWLDFAEHAPRTIVRAGTTYCNEKILGAWSEDCGVHWTGFPSEPPTPAEPTPWGGTRPTGPISISADASTIIWTTFGNPPCVTRDRGRTWQAIPDAPIEMRMIGDRERADTLYGYDCQLGDLYVSHDGGSTISMVARGLPTVVKRRWPTYPLMLGVPGKAGELWIVVNRTLLQVSQFGESVVANTSVGEVTAAGFGKSAQGGNYPTLFVAGKVGNTYGIFRSSDAGVSFRRINDDEHQYGSIGHLAGDPRVFGRVYVGTGGRGIIYGEPASTR